MIDEGRRSTVKEIITKYKREPDLEKTIYVEGYTDKILVKWFLKQAKINNIIVNEINQIQIDKDTVLALELDDNARSRVITLTTLVDNHIIGIIDSDFDFLSEPLYPHKDILCKTDYACMEMYCFNEDTLEKILLGYSEKKQPSNFVSFKGMLSSILKELFLIRYAKDNKAKSLENLDFKKDIKLNSKELIFDRENYMTKYFSNGTTMIDEIKSFIENAKTRSPEDDKKIINGHDFVSLLQIYLEIKQKDATVTFQKSLYSSLEFDKLKEEGMFKKVLSLI